MRELPGGLTSLTGVERAVVAWLEEWTDLLSPLFASVSGLTALITGARPFKTDRNLVIIVPLLHGPRLTTASRTRVLPTAGAAQITDISKVCSTRWGQRRQRLSWTFTDRIRWL